MRGSYLHLNAIHFSGPNKRAELSFARGVNVICGASDTGKSFLAETIDFMLGGSTLKSIPERVPYSSIRLSLGSDEDQVWYLDRAIVGGDFVLSPEGLLSEESQKLRQSHGHDRVDNISGFLLDKIGLLGKRILKSAKQGTTQSLSFRNLARLVIIQEGEIQQAGSPFWDGQFTLKTAELATVKLLLTGIDDSDVVSASDPSEEDNSRQIALLEDLIQEITQEIAELGVNYEESTEQLSRLENTIGQRRGELNVAQRKLDSVVAGRRLAFEERSAIEDRLDEISELQERFKLLDEHYIVDRKRLFAIQETGSLFIHVSKTSCPLCGALAGQQHAEMDCDGNVENVVIAASTEIEKIEQLSRELRQTVTDLRAEAVNLRLSLEEKITAYNELQAHIDETISPEVGELRASYTELIEERATIQKMLTLFDRLEKLKDRRDSLVKDEADQKTTGNKVTTGIPESIADNLSRRIEEILKAWNFPGDCRVHYDKEASDFVIDGKPRGSRGKGLRAITHAAVTIGLLEFCQESGLPHPGFVVMDSPLLAYFKPEGEEDQILQGTDLKERFYEYLIKHHASNSQIIIIENQHPPMTVQDRLAMTVFTRNPSEGRFGLL